MYFFDTHCCDNGGNKYYIYKSEFLYNKTITKYSLKKNI